MENKIKSINALMTAFESRNELLHEEILKNEEAIKEMKKELALIEEAENSENINELKMVI